MTNREMDRILHSSYRNWEAVYDRIKAASMNPRHKIWVSSSPANEYVRDWVDKLSLKGMMRPYEVKVFLDNELKEKEKMIDFKIKVNRAEWLDPISQHLYAYNIPFRLKVVHEDPLRINSVDYYMEGSTDDIRGIEAVALEIKCTEMGDVVTVVHQTGIPARSGRYPWGSKAKTNNDIKDVKFNGPATIVFWKDGTKTIVKCSENDIYDPEKAIMMAMLKKKLGNPSKVRKFFKKWVKEVD